MSEKTKFHNMTKPIKFRVLKLIKQTIVLWVEGIRERIIYSFNYILYKLHIYKRYSYRDNSERVVLVSNEIWGERRVFSHVVRGLVRMTLWEKKTIDLDYFYRIKRDGSKKITLWLKSVDYCEYFTKSHLEDINLRVSDTWYDVSKLPRLKVALKSFKPIEWNNKFPLDEQPLKYNTVEYDLTSVRSLVFQEYIGKTELYSISDIRLMLCYDHSVSAFYDKLSKMTLNDLTR